MSDSDSWIEIPPHVDESEEALLASVLSNPTLGHELYAKLQPGNFYRESNRYIWRSIEACIEDGVDPNYMNVISKLGQHGCLEAVGGPSAVQKLNVEFARPQQAHHHAETVIEFYNQRQLYGACRSVADGLKNHELTYDDGRKIVDESIRDAGAGDVGRSIGEIADDIQGDVDAILEEGKTPYYETGIQVVDTVLGGGMYKSRFYLLAARPKHGKTSLAIAIVCEMIERHGFAVDFWYTDGHDKDPGVAVLAYLSGVPNENIRDGDLNRHQYRELEKARHKVQDWDLDIKDVGSPDPRDIQVAARARSAANENYMCVVDYLQRCDAGYTGSNSGRKNAEAASGVMADIRSENDCIAFGLAQFNRDADEATFPKYNMLKFSGALEQDVNDLLVWHRPDWDDETADEVDERYGILNHQMSKHQAAGGRTRIEVDAKLGINHFDPFDEAKIRQEIKHGV
ncbi:MAG: DnaB-like helicase C-terminal domain-containing protein [Bradymonadaceae bacterium]